MTLKNIVTATLLLVGLTSGFNASRALASRDPITSSVVFGDPQSGNCSGKGICSASDANGISVTFTYVDHYTMVISFSLADLANSQSAQAAYFQNSSYMFDSHFSLYGGIFTQWNLGLGAWINTTSTSNISIVNGTVYDTVEIEYYY